MGQNLLKLVKTSLYIMRLLPASKGNVLTSRYCLLSNDIVFPISLMNSISERFEKTIQPVIISFAGDKSMGKFLVRLILQKDVLFFTGGIVTTFLNKSIKIGWIGMRIIEMDFRKETASGASSRITHFYVDGDAGSRISYVGRIYCNAVNRNKGFALDGGNLIGVSSHADSVSIQAKGLPNEKNTENSQGY